MKMSEYLATSVLVLISKPLLVRRPCRGHHLAPSLRASPHPKRQILGSPSCFLFVCFLSFQVTPPPHPFGLLQSNLVGYGSPPHPRVYPHPSGLHICQGRSLQSEAACAPPRRAPPSRQASPGQGGLRVREPRGCPQQSDGKVVGCGAGQDRSPTCSWSRSFGKCSWERTGRVNPRWEGATLSGRLARPREPPPLPAIPPEGLQGAYTQCKRLHSARVELSGRTRCSV